LNIYFAGTAKDTLSYQNKMKFTTQDVDNDIKPGFNCAQLWHGAWWFKECFYAHLNGKYIGGLHTQPWHGVIWDGFKGEDSLKSSEMKVGPYKV
jgi:hypothetical protein